MGLSRHKQILGLRLAKVKADVLRDSSKYFEYVLNDEGIVKYMEDWLDDEQESVDANNWYWAFDKVYADVYLDEEISNMGMVELFENLDMREIMSKLPHNYWGENSIPDTARIVIDVIYKSGWNYEYPDECDMEMEVVGYMDKDLNIVLMKPESIVK